MENHPQLITYPDSLGGSLSTLAELLTDGAFGGLFGGVHILPPFPSSGDRGFAPLTYTEIEPSFGTWEDIRAISSRVPVMLDMMINHISARSVYFKDYLIKKEASAYAGLFLPLTKFWPQGVPKADDLSKIFLRRELPYSTFGDGGTQTRVWTTFGKEDPSEQIDIDVNSKEAEELFKGVFKTFGDYKVKAVRLDAVGYVIKKLGTSCFFVEPEIYGFLDRIQELAGRYGLELLPEVHAHPLTARKLTDKGWYGYDFILPYRVLEALLLKDSGALAAHIQNSPEKQITILDCHDGIPVKPDVDGLYEAENAKRVKEICAGNGAGFSLILSDEHKDADGFDVHQICGTLFSLLGGNADALVLARAIQLFAPGVPQIYYEGILAGANDGAAAKALGDPRALNRRNYGAAELAAAVSKPEVRRMINLIRFRNTCPAFNGTTRAEAAGHTGLIITREGEGERCVLTADLLRVKGTIKYKTSRGADTEFEI